VTQDEVEGKDVNEFNRRTNEKYMELVSGYFRKSMAFGEA
jgi:hypothetical protein